MAWMSKGPGAGKERTNYLLRAGTGCRGSAHFIVDEQPLCAGVMFRNGPALAPFVCTWVSLRSFDTKCRMCKCALKRRH